MIITIRTRRGPVSVHEDCRVQVFDHDADLQGLPSAFLLPSDFDDAEWQGLTGEERFLSMSAEAGRLRREMTVMRQQVTQAWLAAAIGAVTIVALVILMLTGRGA